MVRTCGSSAPRSFADESGATALEYALLMSMIAVVLIASVMLLGQRVSEAVCEPLDELAANGGAVPDCP